MKFISKGIATLTIAAVGLIGCKNKMSRYETPYGDQEKTNTQQYVFQPLLNSCEAVEPVPANDEPIFVELEIFSNGGRQGLDRRVSRYLISDFLCRPRSEYRNYGSGKDVEADVEEKTLGKKVAWILYDEGNSWIYYPENGQLCRYEPNLIDRIKIRKETMIARMGEKEKEIGRKLTKEEAEGMLEDCKKNLLQPEQIYRIIAEKEGCSCSTGDKNKPPEERVAMDFITHMVADNGNFAESLTPIFRRDVIRIRAK